MKTCGEIIIAIYMFCFRIAIFLGNCFMILIIIACSAMPTFDPPISKWSVILPVIYFGVQAFFALLPIRKIHKSSILTYVFMAIAIPSLYYSLIMVYIVFSHPKITTGSYIFSGLVLLPSLIPLLLFIEHLRYKHAEKLNQIFTGKVSCLTKSTEFNHE